MNAAKENQEKKTNPVERIKKKELESASTDKKHVHAILGPIRTEKFNFLKEVLEQNSDVDVLRVCIDEMYEHYKSGRITLKPILEQQIKNLLGNEYLTKRHLVLNLNDVINDAAHKWIKNRMNEINIHSFPFRRELTEDEQRVAMVFVENQFNYDRGMSVEDLQTFLEDMEKARLLRILKKFTDNSLLLINQFDGIDYYHAPLP